jgi:hypothetical protein
VESYGQLEELMEGFLNRQAAILDS